jgi:type IV pilus assembly protein PilQ
MRKWTKTAGLLFCAISSVYYGSATIAGQASPAVSNGGSNVKVLGDLAADVSPAAQPTDDTTAPSTAPKVTLNSAGAFSIQISNDTNLVELLRLIGSQAQISIIPGKDIRDVKVPAMDLYNVTISDALNAILDVNDLHWQQKGNFIFVYSNDEWTSRQKAADVVESRIYHLHYVGAADVEKLIQNVLSADGKVAMTPSASTGIDTGETDTASGGGGGGGSGSTGGNTYAGNDMLIVTDHMHNLAMIDPIIEQVDQRPQQILIEATILQATLTENNAMGIDFSLMGGVNFDTLLANGTTVTSALSGNILNTTANTTGTGTGTTNNTNVTHGGYAGFTTGNYDTQVPQGGLQVGIVKNNLGVFLSALESTADTTVVANPKILVLDKQSGEVHVGQELGYTGGTTVTQTSSTSTVQFLETGTTLSFRPYIGADGYIRMEIHPEDSTGSINTSVNPPLPNKNTAEVTSNVMVKDGNTIVIGGLFHESDSTSKSQVPLLGSIPILGAIFRSQADATNREEIIILLTPHIIKDDAEYSKAGEEEMKQAEEMRVGVRKGMMWFGRERLAESCYECAVAEMNKPRPSVDLALWHLDCAINLNPKFLEAIEMKERITGRQVTDVDNSAIRDFVRRQVMDDNPPPAPLAPPATRPIVDNALNAKPISVISLEPDETAAAGK